MKPVIYGLAGLTLTDDEREFYRDADPCGYILFKRNVQDRAQLRALTDSLRDLVSTIVETNISLRDYRQNLIVKKVSSWAAIITVPALITGYYGMNVPFPGFGRTWGVLISTALIILAWVCL